MRPLVLLSDEEVALLTDDEKARYKGDLEITRALQTPLDYMLATSSEAAAHPHIKLLSDTLVALVEHRLYKDGPGPDSVKNEKRQYVHPVTGERALAQLQIDMPPGHGKSFMTSHHLPAWFLSNYPDRKVGLASYEADFAREWGGKVQQVIEDNPDFGVKIDKKKQAQDNWGIAGHKGGMFTAGAGGPITGKRFHLGIVDDPIKNQDEALSETIRTKLRNWWATSFRTRAHPDGETVFVLMSTRWHEDDLAGQLTEAEPEKWYRLSLPAIAFEAADTDGVSIDPETGVRDPLGRKPGEALAPEMWPIDTLLDLKSAQGEMWFQAMFQGRPSIAEGNKFKNFPRYRLAKDARGRGTYTVVMPDGAVHTYEESKCFRFATVDLAMTAKTSSDWNVFTVFDVTHDHKLLIRAVDRKRVSSEDHMDWFSKNYRTYRPRYAGIEKEMRGTMLIKNLTKQGGFATIELPPIGDKEARAVTATTCFRDDLVFIPEEAEWVDEFVKELKKFPNAKHDDQVDTISYGAEIFSNMTPWAIFRTLEDDSLEARMERHYNSEDNTRHEHPQLGDWF